MAIKTKTKFEVKEGKTTLTLDHLDEELTFIYPSKGPDTYANVQEALIKDNLKAPTASQNASLIYSAFKNQDNEFSQNIINTMKNRWLWCFTGNLYVPDKGVFIQDNPDIKNNKISMNLEDLEKKLEANDSSVRFVPFGYKIQEQTSKQLEKNQYIIGLAGEEGAQKLAEIADMYKDKEEPYVYSFENIEKETARATALDSYWDRNCLYVDGDCFAAVRNSLAFGVQ